MTDPTYRPDQRGNDDERPGRLGDEIEERPGRLSDADERETPPTAETPPSPTRSAPATDKAVPRSRTGAAWIAITATIILLLLLVIFIAQNGQKVEVHFLGFSGTVSLAVALLAATVAGGILTVMVGTARIVQLRIVARRNRAMEPPQ
jgi:uncharacterized integral membrane protein